MVDLIIHRVLLVFHFDQLECRAYLLKSSIGKLNISINEAVSPISQFIPPTGPNLKCNVPNSAADTVG